MPTCVAVTFRLEGSGHFGKDRKHHFHIAIGSAKEVRAGILVPQAWEDLKPATIVRPLALLDRLIAVLWRLGR